MSTRSALALVILSLLLAASSEPVTYDSRIDSYRVQITFLEGLPSAGEPSRIAVTVLEPENETIPRDPGILSIMGPSVSYQLSLDRAPTTIVSLPGLESGSYDVRVQVPGSGVTDALELTLAEPPLFEANPLIGSVLILLGAGMLVFILFSDRFNSRSRIEKR